MKGFMLLMTVWLANVLAAHAYTCHCDCRPFARNMYQVQTHHLYYNPYDSSLSHQNQYESVIKKVEEGKQSDMVQQTQAEQYEVEEKSDEMAPIVAAEGAAEVAASGGVPEVAKSDGAAEVATSGGGAEVATSQVASEEASENASKASSMTSEEKKKEEAVAAVAVEATKETEVSENSEKPKTEPMITESMVKFTQPKFSYHFRQNHIHHEHEEGKKEESHDEHEHHHHHHGDEHIKYEFEYKVNDKKTKDIKSHKEERNGDLVTGEYSLLEDNGNVRTVKYTADWKNGFNAEVLNSKKARRFSPYY